MPTNITAEDVIDVVTRSASRYCGYGSCDNTPGHRGQHRCRCGRLVDEAANGCVWHSTRSVGGQ